MLQNRDLKTGIWNKLTLYQADALDTLRQEVNKYRLDITAIQQIRWLGTGILRKGRLH